MILRASLYILVGKGKISARARNGTLPSCSHPVTSLRCCYRYYYYYYYYYCSDLIIIIIIIIIIKQMHTKFWLQISMEGSHLKDHNVSGRMTLNWILNTSWNCKLA